MNLSTISQSLSSEDPLVVSFSGGRTSAFMAFLIKKMNLQRPVYFIFANTGLEREETLEFVNQCDQAFNLGLIWVEAVTNPERGKGVSAKVVNFETASRNGEPFEAMIAKFGIPNKQNPHCTRELKRNVIRNYFLLKGIKLYDTAIGIRNDETRRLNWETAKKNRLVYPLVSVFPVDKKYIDGFWNAQPFNLKLKVYEGNCKLCFKKSTRKLLTIIKEDPSAGNFTEEMEKKYSHFIPEGKGERSGQIAPPPYFFFRDYMSTQDLKELAAFPFEPAVDDVDPLHKVMFFDPELDATDGCEESCEVF